MRLIDTDALRKNSKMLYSIHAFEPVEGYTQDQLDAATTINATPTVHGQWEILEEANMFDTCGNNAKYVACTNCEFRWNDIYSAKNYFECCPSCGAKMDVEEHSV